MARIFLLKSMAPLDLPASAGLMVDSSEWAGPNMAKFIKLPDVATMVLLQDANLDVQYPGGSIGAFVAAGIQAGLQDWYHISSFYHDGLPIVEQGVIVADVTLAWEIDFPESYVQSYFLSSSAGTITLPSNIYEHALVGVNVGATETWTLQANLTDGYVIAQTTMKFGFKVYYGRGSITPLSEGQVEALTGVELSTTPLEQYDFVAGSVGNEYLWICYPEEFGTMPLFIDTLTALPVEFVDAAMVSITNVHGVVRNYNRFRSLNGLNGVMTLKAFE